MQLHRGCQFKRWFPLGCAHKECVSARVANKENEAVVAAAGLDSERAGTAGCLQSRWFRPVATLLCCSCKHKLPLRLGINQPNLTRKGLGSRSTTRYNAPRSPNSSVVLLAFRTEGGSLQRPTPLDKCASSQQKLIGEPKACADEI
jgi:hypothetical protein